MAKLGRRKLEGVTAFGAKHQTPPSPRDSFLCTEQPLTSVSILYNNNNNLQMASNTDTTIPSSIQITGITVLMDPVVDHKLSIKLLIGGADFIKQHFGPKLPRLRRELSPPLTLQGGSQLVIQLREHRSLRPTRVLAEGVFMNQNLQQSLLGTEYKLRDNPSIMIDIAPGSNTLGMTLSSAIRATGQRKSVLDHLGKSKTFIETVLNVGTAVSELHPVAKAVLAAVGVVYKKFQDQQQCDKLILDLAENMSQILGYIEDAEQFARLAQFIQALKEVRPLMEETANFILQYNSQSAGVQLLDSIVSSSSSDIATELSKRFNQFKQQFDRGLAVHANVSIEKVLFNLGLF
ncbi:hypothetical protein JAAARDRAFT_195131 [Jaapia argillacea MUCL 33604]|uniref:Uncharacterized protein n=1 Tax=Jaapia argillacea MUCL 33604 TaxID=933084 RepID=A0A067Q1N9_9AGAM|nr:hypothetical protein JAAARDRAFT_195131 [Jaapia argillacea MUCL 33604]